MRVAFLLPSLSPSGGVRVVLEHVEALRRQRDVSATVIVAGPPAPDQDVPASIEALTLNEARAHRWDVLVATWWTTALVMHELDAATRLLFVQGDDERSYQADEPFDRLGAAAALALADGVLAVSSHVARAVVARRPGVWCRVLPVGVSKDPYEGIEKARTRAEGQLRVLVEGQPSLPGKRVAEAVQAARNATSDVHITVAALEPLSAGGLGADELTMRLDAAGMAALYAESDVLIKLSLSEGLGLPPIEAAHVGTPSIVTPYGGHGSWMQHGENGLLVGFDDERAVSGWVTSLAADEALRRRLGEGARRTAERWPDVGRAAASWRRSLHDGLHELSGATSSPADVALLMRRHIVLGRADHASLQAELRDHKLLVEELFESRDEAAQKLEEIAASNAYRTAVAIRGGLRRLVRPRAKRPR